MYDSLMESEERRERVRRRNQRDRNCRGAESAQQRENDEMVNGWISKRTQLQLTRVTGTAYHGVR